MRKNYFLMSVIVMIAVLFGFSATHAQEGPKIVNLTEILNPVVGEDGMEPFQFTFQGGAAWGDFNNDGFMDLITTGVYVKKHELDDEGNPIPNLNEDGQEIPLRYDDEGNWISGDDWIVSTKLYVNNGDGTFTKIAHPFPHIQMGGVTWFDYDNDGNLDLILSGRTSTSDNDRFTGIWRNLGPEGNYQFEEVLPGEFEYFDVEGGNRPTRVIAAGDFDNDGWMDLAFIGRSSVPGELGRIVSLYKNLEGTGFMKINLPVRGVKPFVQQNGGSIAWGDFNNDGFLDLITFGYVAGGGTQTEHYSGYDFERGGVLCLYMNNGDGTFAEPITFPAGEDGEVALGDFNNDGNLDFVYHNYSWWPGDDNGWRAFLYENNGDGTFTQYSDRDGVNGLRGDQSVTVAWGDINNDGFEDLLVNKANPSAIFYNNAGNLPFVRNNLFFMVDGEEITRGVRGGATCLVDFDNDGDLDIFMNGYDDTNQRAHLLRNDLDEAEGLPVNLPPSAPTNLKAEVDNEGATVFTWDAATDDLTPQAALRYNLYVKQGNLIKIVLPADLQTGRLKVSETLAPIMGTTYKLFDLNGEYEWGVQAIDNGKRGGAFARANGESSIEKIKNTTAVNVIGKKGAIEIISATALQGAISVYSISGINLFSKTGQISGTTIDLPTGVFIVKVATTEGTSVKKVIVK